MAGDLEFRERLQAMGSEIRARRESLGLSIEDASAKTKLRPKYLLAVETGDDSQAPGATYFRAFLKTYSTFLGLDGMAYSAAYLKAIEDRDAPPPRGRPKVTVPVAPPPADKPAPRHEEPAKLVEEPAPENQSPEKRLPKNLPAAKAGAPEVPAQMPGQAPSRPAVEDSPIPVVPVARSSAPARRELPLHRAPKPAKRGTSPVLWVFLMVFIVAAGAYVAITLRTPPPAVEPPVSTTPEPPSPPPPVTTPEPEPEPESPAPKVTRTEVDPANVTFTVDRTPIEMVIRTGEGEDSYCWVRIRADGQVLLERTLRPGHEEKITAKSEVSIRAGKPWVLSLVINGQDQGVAGVFGPVKDITVTVKP